VAIASLSRRASSGSTSSICATRSGRCLRRSRSSRYLRT
jgi:hypothetical protein